MGKTKSSRKKAVEKLDKIFSQYIRLRHAVNGDAQCVTCGARKPWKELQCGHYESRGSFGTRWDEKNCHVQCYGCNVARKGNYPAYARYMVSTYGASILDTLAWKANNSPKLMTVELELLIVEYEGKVKELLTKQ